MEGRAAAALIQSGRVVKDTRRLYNTKLNKMKKFFQDNLLEALDEDGEILVPLELDHCLHFFGVIHQNSNSAQVEDNHANDGNEEQAVKAVSTIAGYKSAIAFLY